jgi:hypothetical protein
MTSDELVDEFTATLPYEPDDFQLERYQTCGARGT